MARFWATFPIPFVAVLLALLAAAALQRVQAQDAGISYRIVAPAPGTQMLRTAQGAEAEVVIAVASEDVRIGVVQLVAPFGASDAALAQYTFAGDDPTRCPPPVAQATSSGRAMVFALGPIPVGATLACRYRITRAAASTDDLRFTLCGRAESHYACQRVFYLGTLPDLGLTIEPARTRERDGSQLALLRIDNHSSIAIASRTVSTHCAEFGGGLFNPVDFTIETGFPGACREVEGNFGCIDFTGMHNTSHAFELGPVAAGSSASCQVRLRPLGYPVPPGGVGVEFVDDRVGLDGGAVAFDPYRGNEQANLALAMLPIVVAPIPVDRAALFCLVLALAALAALALAPQRSRH